VKEFSQITRTRLLLYPVDPNKEVFDMKKRYLSMAMASAMFITLTLCLSHTALAASFDCDKATTKVEKMICVNAALSGLDEELAEIYQNAMKNEIQAESIKFAQKAWLKERNRCEEISCLKSAYQARIVALKQPVSVLAPNQSTNSPPPGKKDETCLEPKIDWRNYQWILITGNGKTACEEMLAYLKSRPKDQPPPVCPEDRLPPNGNWTRPEWREVSTEQKEKFIADVPKKKQESYESYFPHNNIAMVMNNKVLNIAYTDISGDSIPEHLLALIDKGWLECCRTSPYCASQDSLSKGYIWLQGSLSYDLLPLNDEGTEIDWQHRAIGQLGLVAGSGELIHYKKRPYWLTTISWDQHSEDNFKKNGHNPNDANWNTFQLAPLIYRNDEKINTYKTLTSARFANSIEIAKDQFATCDFGYFHRDLLKQHPPTTRR
jgi:uncharacterized protein YecT (DUF1311 family)